VASGAGDFAIWASRFLAGRGLDVRIDGCDISDTAVEFASRRAAAGGRNAVTFFRWDALNEPLATDYDFVTCSLFLHHLTEVQVAAFLQKIAAAARNAVLVDDLQRSLAGYGLAVLAAATLTRSPVVRVDAPRSVRAAFSIAEAGRLTAAAGLHGASIRRHWPQRYLIVWEKPWMAQDAT
jgi:2-polyprenyl-3-methyl-5-hydroxy-6-metoxy-1,4-benzoquinol methylase